ncbi:MAG: hypothetical protein KKA07_16555 [Bacteroidetes bacterium]|nr:hypothetical protein [Bacteroidota bacterium]MBU1720678.1 hypothetical protein [Bacteroidota bacterium]
MNINNINHLVKQDSYLIALLPENQRTNIYPASMIAVPERIFALILAFSPEIIPVFSRSITH